ncbi:MAG: acyl-CoA dehydrogenase [Chitinophagaceae bacterium]|nr:MAG: acyl-CoA dehydrogenase [Chitinophagaceae bacterium]
METTKKVLKGGEFLIRESSAEEVFTREELNEEQMMIADMCREFIETNVDPNLERIDEQEEGLTVELMDKSAELGLLGLAIPEEYQGFGKDFNTNSVAAEILGGAHSFAVSIAAHTGIGTLPILYYGNEEQKQKYLPKSASGELKFAYCLTEPGSGSDAMAAKTKAVLNDEGTHYIMNGQKMWITNSGFADVFVVFAKIDGEQFTGFIVERGYEGISFGAEEKKMGIKGSSTRQVFFENVKVPKENILGEIGKGHKIAFNILNIGRYKLCAMALGGAKRASTVAVKYANERHQFNVPISSFGAIQHKLAEMAVKIFACDSVTYRVSDYIDKMEKELLEDGKSYGDALLGAAEEYAIECAMLKVFGSEVLDFVVDEAVQVFGGTGFSEEYPVARAYRDARINRIFEGTNEINRLLTVDMLMKRAMSGKLDLMSPAMAIQKELTSVPDFGSDEDDSLFAEEKKAVKQAKKAALMVAGAAAQKLMQKLKDEQEIVMNITDMLIEIFASESAILHAEKLINTKGEEASIYGDLAKVYVNDAMDKINKSGKDAIAAFADGDEKRMMLMGLKRFTKYGPLNTKSLRRKIAKELIEADNYCF